MNQSQSKMIRYVVVGLCGFALLLVIARLALRETPPPSPDLPPIRAVTVSSRVPLVGPDNVAPQDTPANPVARSSATPTNAATIYRRAFATYDALSQEQKNLLGNWRTNVDSSVVAELCAKLQPLCDLMHHAAAATNCDWEPEQPITAKTGLPDLTHCRSIARAAVWSAARCRTADPAGAVDDLVAASRLGQNVSSPTLLGHLVDLSIQGMVIDSVAEHASVLAGVGGARLAELLNSPNYDESLRRAFEQEADMYTREADRLAALPPEEAMREPMTWVDSAQKRSTGLAQYIAEIRQAAELQRQYAKASELPEAEYRAWLTSLDEAVKTNPFVEHFVSSLGLAADKTQAMTVKSAMAAAGLAVMQQGTDALQSHLDPTTGQPFAYKQTTDGFELESSFQVGEKSLKLSFK